MTRGRARLCRALERARPACAAAALACAAAAWMVPARAGAQGPLQGLRTDYATGTSPYSVALADLDGTGHPDMVVANFASASVSVFFDDGPGRFNLRRDQVVGTNPRAVVAGDVNADGLVDIVTANSGANTVSVVLGRRGGTFNPHVDFATGNGPRALAMADVNGDGMPDLAVADYFGATASVLFNDGHGRFPVRAAFATGTGPAAIAIGDVDGDGRPDLVVANSGSNTVSVLRGDGRGGFAQRVNSLTGTSPVAVALGDVNGDGRPDCVTANYSANTVSVLLASGAGGFATHVDVPAGQGPTAIAIADVSGDGRADVATANGKSDTVTLLSGDGAGGFASSSDFVTGTLPVAVALGDLNGDGRPDILTANSAARTVSVNYGTYVGALDAGTTVATGSSPRALAVGDLDHDGRQDVVVTSYLSNMVSFFHGAGGGAFDRRIDLPTAAGPLGVGLGDLDGDGIQDFAVANAGDGSVSVFLANGYGGFRDRVDYPVLEAPCAIALGDVVGDSVLDIVVVNQGSNKVSVFMGLGGGGFGARTDWDAGPSPRAVAIGDLNSDGWNDIMVSGFNGRSVSVLLNTFNVGFTPQPPWGDPGLNPGGLAVVDVNGDHYLDVVVANYGSASVSVLLGNGAGGYRSTSDYPAGAGARDVAVDDVNDDGNIDLVVANEAANTVSVLLGDGRGGFATHADFPAGPGAWEVDTMDPDGLPGGYRDIVISNHGGNTFTILSRREPTTVSLVADPGPSVQGEAVSLAATVAPVSAQPAPPTGPVRFFAGTTLLGSAMLQGGRAVLASPPLAPGLGTLSAAYTGDAAHLPSLSPGIAHRVYRCGTTLSLAASPDTAFEGEPVVLEGAGFPGVTSLRFGGIPAIDFTLTPTAFDVDSARVRIVATVPIGALSGPVRIDCPCGTVLSPDVIEVRRTFGLANTHTKSFGWLLGIGWPVARSLVDTLGTPLADLALSGRADVDWRVKRWDPAVQGYVSVERLKIGQGYWIQTRNPWRAQLTGTVTRETTLVLPLLTRGWHLFGNPFSTPVPTAGLRVLKRGVARPIGSQTDVQPTVFAWNDAAGRYVAGGSIPAGGLFWVRRLSLTTAESLLVEPPSSATPAAPAAPGPAPDWSASLSVRQADAGADTVTLGAAALEAGVPHPLTAQVPPPAPLTSVSLALEAPDGAGEVARYRSLIRDRAATSAWSLVIEGAVVPGEVELALDAGRLPAGMALVVSDPLTGYRAPLERGRALTLAALAPTRRLRLDLVAAGGAGAGGVAERIRAYPSPFGGSTGFWFSHAVAADARVALYDLAGREVRVLERRAAPAGENVLVWDGRDARGEDVPAAVYFARCEVGGLRRVLRVVRIR